MAGNHRTANVAWPPQQQANKQPFLDLRRLLLMIMTMIDDGMHARTTYEQSVSAHYEYRHSGAYSTGTYRCVPVRYRYSVYWYSSLEPPERKPKPTTTSDK